MIVRKILISLLVINGMCNLLLSQVIGFPPEKNITTGEIVPMVIGNDIQGYFATIFEDDLKKEDKWLYNLVIMDVNFRIVQDVKFKVDRDVWERREVFNGSGFCFTYANENSGRILHLFFDREGKKVGTINFEDIKKTDIYPHFSDELYPVPYTGFFRNGLNPKKAVYCEMLDNAGNAKWKLYPKDIQVGKAMRTESLSYFQGDSNFIILNVSLPNQNEKEAEKQSDNFLRVHDASTGAALFTINQHHTAGLLSPMKIQMQDEQMVVFGQFFDADKAGDTYKIKKSLGFYSQVYSRDGKIVTETYSNWEEELSKFIDVDQQSQVDNDNNIWFHDIIRTVSGKYFVICELYHRGFSNIVINGGFMIVRDMIALELDEKLSLKKVHRFEKFRSQHPMASVDYKSNYELGKIMARSRMFDHKFTTQTADHSVFTSVYDNYDKSDKAKKKFIIGAIGYNQDGELVNPKISLTSDPDEILVMPAKTGYVAVIEVFNKEKRASLTLYKFDL